jgi:uncharacterized protein DUF1525
MRLQSEAGAQGPLSGALSRSRPTAVSVTVIAYAPVAFFHCMHCEVIWQHSAVRTKDRREQMETSLPEDLKHQYQQLSDWVRGMVEAHGRRLRFRIVDAASVEGWVTSVRYGVRQYPAVIIDGTATSPGAQFERATGLIERRLAAVNEKGSA